MTTTNCQSAYQNALDTARVELEQIAAVYNRLLLRQQNLRTAAETLEAFLSSDCFSGAEPLEALNNLSAAAPAVAPHTESPAPLSPRVDSTVEAAPQSSAPVQELPSDPILRRIHGVLDLASVS